VIARLKTSNHQVWQFNENLPTWVANCTELNSGDLYLVRRSGKQLIKPSEWLVQDLDGEPLWLTDTQFRSQYEIQKE
jgi:hypothetical protein